MKNLHVLTTDKPNFGKYLVLNKEGKLCIWNTNTMGSQKTLSTQHIYITSDEDIKEGYVLNTFNNTVYKIVPDNSSRELLANPTILPLCAINREHYFKIILTTDQDLIKNGVQAIDDEFLEWFVKNPSCEEVEVESFCKHGDNCPSKGAYDKQYLCEVGYKIIIPKEEPTIITDWLNEHGDPEISKKVEKEAELKEAAETFSKQFLNNGDNSEFEAQAALLGVLYGAKWQAKRMYSEEDMIEFHKWAFQKNRIEESDKTTKELLLEWFEQSKKKQ